MLKRILIILYSTLSAASLYTVGALFNFMMKENISFKLSFFLFDVTNTFVLMIILVFTLLVGFVNIFIFGDDKLEIPKTSTSEILSDKNSIETELNQQIQNRYDAKVEEINARILAEIKKANTPESKLEKSLWALCNEFELSQGLVYQKDAEVDFLSLKSTYAFIGQLENINKIEIGIGLNGQVARTGDYVFLKDVPKGYMKIVSGLGEVSPDYLLIVPIKKDNKILGLVELAGMGTLNTEEVKTVKEMVQKIYSTLL